MKSPAIDETEVLSADSLSKNFDGVTALRSFSLKVNQGEILAMLGPNGAGKTTFFNIVTGFLSADSGALRIKGRSYSNASPHRMVQYGIARTFQDLRLIGMLSALDNVLLSFAAQPGEHLVRGLLLRPRAASIAERGNRERAVEILAEVGLADKANDFAGHLSYGQQKLLTLACVIATGADILLLDEPVAGVSPALMDSILILIKALACKGKTVILIEHNIYAVEKVADRVVFMDAGENVAEGSPHEVLSDERVLEAYLK
jgi:ABC-type branched-subunit amino acid transport system ATPase component